MRFIGFSTGALAYSDFKKAIKLMNNSSASAIELSALRRNELEPLVASINELDLSRYSYIAVHAPSKFESDDEPQVIKLLETFANKNWPIVLHPDAIKSFDRWRVFGNLLLIENMDKRKSIGRTHEELEKIFDYLPDARFCFDIAHARQYDPTMNEAMLILNKFSSLITQIHISDIEEQYCNHIRLSTAAITDYKMISKFIPHDISVILESIIDPAEIDIEIKSAIDSLKFNDLTFATTRVGTSREISTALENYIIFGHKIEEILIEMFGKIKIDKISTSNEQDAFDFLIHEEYRVIYVEAKYRSKSPILFEDIEKSINRVKGQRADLWFVTNSALTNQLSQLVTEYNASHNNHVYVIVGESKEAILQQMTVLNANYSNTRSA